MWASCQWPQSRQATRFVMSFECSGQLTLADRLILLLSLLRLLFGTAQRKPSFKMVSSNPDVEGWCILGKSPDCIPSTANSGNSVKSKKQWCCICINMHCTNLMNCNSSRPVTHYIKRKNVKLVLILWTVCSTVNSEICGVCLPSIAV